jgi:hypothetical protein
LVDEKRRWYAVDRDLASREDAEAACGAVIDVLRPVLRRARVDVVSDHAERMPPDVAAAEAALRALARRQHPGSRGPLMAVDITPGDPEWSAFQRYAAWSIHVDLLAGGEHEVASLHDCGWSVTAALTEAEAKHLRERLQPTAPLTLLTEVHERRRQQKQDRRRQRLAAFSPLDRHRR